MAYSIVSDALWERIEPLLPAPKPRRWRYPGRKPLDRRKVLTGIIFVLKTGIPWEALPAEMGCGCGMSCLNYLKAWHRRGVWQRLHVVLLAELQGADRIDWSRAAADSSSVRALGGGEATGPNPTDRRKLGSKHHLLVDSHGVPLAATLTAANTPDVNELLNLVDAVPPVAGKIGRPQQRPKQLYADRAYDSEPHRAELRRLGIRPHLARRRTGHGSGLGVFRWMVERGNAWLHNFRKLRLRTDRSKATHHAFMMLALSLICMTFV
jgi:transposase